MKTIFTSIFSLALLIAGSINAQTTYNITSSETWGNNGKNSYPNPCYKCTFDLADGVVLTIEKDVTFQEVDFRGGTVIVDQKSMMLWTDGLKNYFTKTNIVFKGAGRLTGNGPIVMNDSKFTFFGTTNMTSNHSLEMISSTLNFNQNSSFLGNGTGVVLTNSHMVAGDGLISSTATIKMNGTKLVLTDKASSLDIMNNNNSYFNWSDYSSTATNQTFTTKETKTNCGGGFPNACSAPVLYGPISLTPTGLAKIALVLPVVIADFTITNGNKVITLNWSTKQESNSAFFAIERSIDGASWKQIGQVKAAGNSVENIKYSFIDYSIVTGTSHYRLRMADLDNKVVYSDVKSIRSASMATIQVYPNPATDFVNITLDAKASNTLITLINQNGQVVIEKKVSANSGVINLPLTQMQAGLYVIKMSDDKGAAESVKLIVQH
jgi:type IX secretion system substrate protein